MISKVVLVQYNSRPPIYAVMVNLELPYGALVSPSTLVYVEPILVSVCPSLRFQALITNPYGVWAKYAAEEENIWCRVMINGLNVMFGNQAIFYGMEKKKISALAALICKQGEGVQAEPMTLESQNPLGGSPLAGALGG